MTVKDLVKILSSIEDQDVRIYCSNNVFDLKNVFVTDQCVLISVGKTNNPVDSFEIT